MIKRALRSLLTVGGALLLVSATAGCLLGPPEDPENPGAEYEEEYYDEEAEYGTESGAIRVDRPAAVQQQSFTTPVREDDGGQINHGTPDPLNPVYMPSKPPKQTNSWSR